MTHWQASSALGLLLTGRYRPVCAFVHSLPDSAFRRGFIRATDWWFGEADHARRVADTYAIGAAVRGYEPPPPIMGRTGPTGLLTLN